MTTETALHEALREICRALRMSGLNAALLVLNKRVPHRFTAVYKLERDQLRNVALVDKLNEVVPSQLLTVPQSDSYCQFVLRDSEFQTDDSGRDQRLDGHPYQGVVASYIGLPILRADGSLFGTFCHFDTSRAAVSDDELTFLEDVVELLPDYVIA